MAKKAVKPMYVWLTRESIRDGGWCRAYLVCPRPDGKGRWKHTGQQRAICIPQFRQKLEAAGITVKPGGDTVRCRLVLDEPKTKAAPKRKPKVKGKK